MTVQVSVPEQSPLQPVNVEPASAEADSVTVCLGLNVYAPQVLADAQVRLPEMRPLPIPALVNVRMGALNTAVTDLAVSMVTVQVGAEPHSNQV